MARGGQRPGDLSEECLDRYLKHCNAFSKGVVANT
jgi:hypothetical protein